MTPPCIPSTFAYPGTRSWCIKGTRDVAFALPSRARKSGVDDVEREPV